MTGTAIDNRNDKLRPLPNAIVALAVAAIVAASFVGAFIMWPRGDGPLQVIVHDSDGVEHVLDLSRDQRVVIETELGRNEVVIEGGKARMGDADCPNGDCMRQHAISEPGQQLICLPHELWVEIVPQGGQSGQMDVGAVESDGTPDVDLIAR